LEIICKVDKIKEERKKGGSKMKKILKNKPLREAIFEVRWQLQKQGGNAMIDPNYKILVGSIYDKIRKEYPFHEELPTAAIPDEISGYVVKHRFRAEKDKWPLIQIGPGIITLNDTKDYQWEDFKTRISFLLKVLFKMYPESKTDLKINGLLLRYINAINFDYDTKNILTFLKKKMKIELEINSDLFKKTSINDLPIGLDLRLSFPSSIPKGAIHLKFARGKIRNSDALIWETQVQSIGKDAPKTKKEINSWTEEAHELSIKWFFGTIKGDLERMFE